MGKTRATFLTSIFLIPEASTFVTFDQFPSSMYNDFFEITQDVSDNPYCLIKLVTMSLGCTEVYFASNITGPFTPDVLPFQRYVVVNLNLLKLFSSGFSFPLIKFSST